jgi:hypothetical protein
MTASSVRIERLEGSASGGDLYPMRLTVSQL